MNPVHIRGIDLDVLVVLEATLLPPLMRAIQRVAPLDAYLYWHSDVDRDPANRWLREQIIGVFTGR